MGLQRRYAHSEQPCMSSTPITLWINQLQAGDAVAAQRLWEAYFVRLVSLARRKLEGSRRRVADEEDVALSAFDSFCRGARDGRFPQLTDRDNLWRLLVVITARKAQDQVEWERRLKRGGGLVQGESALLSPSGPEEEGGLAQVASAEPTPEFAAQMAEELQRLLARLGDDQLRSIAVWKMEGYSNEEIATRLACATPTVERRLRLIRSLWQEGQPT
jgi:DNA-directed RNA polymerase specialized sigma24 family protein